MRQPNVEPNWRTENRELGMGRNSLLVNCAGGLRGGSQDRGQLPFIHQFEAADNLS